MRYLIRLSKLIDALNDRLGWLANRMGGLAAAGVAAIIGIYPECPAMGTRSLRCRSC